MINAQGLQKSYGTVSVLADVTFTLGDGQHAALVGHNGTGKTTILKILAGLVTADVGKVDFGPLARVGYLPQDTSAVGDETVFDYVRRVMGLDGLETEMNELSVRFEEPGVPERYAAAEAAFERVGGYGLERRVESMLAGLGMERVSLSSSVARLSSGQKSKVAMAALLLQDNDVLLLDEPTNNLDLPALAWLETFIHGSKATVLVVSHDRRFIDRIADKVIVLDWHTRRALVSNGTYSDYLIQSEKERARQLEAYLGQQEEIGRLSARAVQMKQRAAAGARWTGSDNDKHLRGFKRDQSSGSGRGAKAIERRIEQMQRVEKPFERDPLDIDIGEDLGVGDRTIRLVDVVAGRPGGFVVGPISQQAAFGERFGILGMNGVGKSTLLKTVTGHLAPISGRVYVGGGVRMGDMLQEHDTLPRDLSPFAFLKERAGFDEPRTYALLARFGVSANIAKESIVTLSPGGRARVLIALFSALQKNVIVLDEPTNHLDLEAMDALESALEFYQGTIIIVSHDRYFLEKMRLDTLVELVDGHLQKIEDFAGYLRQAEERAKRLMHTNPSG